MTRSAHLLGDAVLGGGLGNKCFACRPKPAFTHHPPRAHPLLSVCPIQSPLSARLHPCWAWLLKEW